ncbi:MAG: right-handed parallel beta-helix repeat-containing protein [Methanothrix sp.]|nr:right-handed parallel beta-helix repeat-containing protein [Methanothrix sp.]
MASRILNYSLNVALLTLVLCAATVAAESQLELRSGDILYSPVLDSNEKYSYSNVEWILYKIEIENNKDNEPIKVQIMNHAGGNFKFNWRMDKKRSSRSIDFYINGYYKSSCKSDKWSEEPVGFIINKSDELELRLTSTNLKGGWIEIAFPKQENIGSSPTYENKTANECNISAGANLSMIIDVLKKPCKSVHIERNTNLQNVIYALDQLQNDEHSQENVFDKTLYLQNGDYNGNIEINAEDFLIKPELGAEAVIISSNYNQFNILINNTHSVYIEGISLKNGDYGVCIHSSNNCSIYNSFISDFKYAGLLIVNSTDNEIQNNIIDSAIAKTDGLQLDSSTNFLVRNNSIHVSNFEYYIDNQTGTSSLDINNIYIKKERGNNYIDIDDNQIEYYCNDSMICHKYRDNSCYHSPLATKNNIWWLE